jgi:hypothetical protein
LGGAYQISGKKSRPFAYPFLMRGTIAKLARYPKGLDPNALSYK